MNKREKRNCKNHGEIDFVYRSRSNRWHCTKCVSENVSKRRRKMKYLLVEGAGSTCLDCGFQGPPFLFDFDHRNPNHKSFGISSGITRSIASLREEAEKCDLVCSNCHRMRTHKQRCKGCEYCIEGYNISLKKEPKGGLDFTHGTSSGYNRHKCRCEECRKYHRDCMRRYRKKE